jgi:asparagine synthase (glutamine-hydrolysing)
MVESLFHRGPDEDGIFSNEKVSLGIRRLSIIDVETGHQPVHNEDKSIWAVANGEIYNFQDLRKTLKEKGHRFYTDHSDIEVIVHLYEEYGPGFLHKLNGMFAIALWDRANKKLYLIRDRMGVKPLFYAQVKNFLVFGSEIKAILSHPAYSRDINYEALYHYFSFKHIPAPLTAFRGISSLLPGEILTYSLSSEGISRERWWKVRFKENDVPDEEFIKSKLLSLLEDATRLRMISDVPFGAYLSGGVDSSVIVALMSRFSDKPLKTFSLGYEDQLHNKEADLFHARRVSEAYSTEHYEYIMSHKELLEDIGDIIGSFDQPFSGTISTYFLSKLITENVKVALSGDGSDERLYEKVKEGTLTGEEKDLFKPCDMDFLQRLYDISGGDEFRWRYNLFLATDEEKSRLISDTFKAKLNGSTTFSLVNKYFMDLTSKDPLNRILEMEWNTLFPDQVLAFVDFLSMAHSVEIRSPFLDYRLVEFVATLPGEIKIKNGVVKDILKNTVEHILPEGIIKRPKEGFVLPVFDWMVEKLRGYTLDILSKEKLRRHGLLNQNVVNSLVQAYHSGERRQAGRVWNLMMFQVWWERYFG